MDALIPVNILIGDRSYRIKIAAKDEEVIRKTIKQINDKIIEFKTQFAGKDMQDYIAMVLLWYATLPDTRKDPAMQDDTADMEQALKLLQEQINAAL
ncbi:MAG: cell division protein ZapA [Bacteroidetes bacterium]|nr:cell division protein ZapA [Bacteroidota bacterium]